jgi:hypothetical protein
MMTNSENGIICVGQDKNVYLCDWSDRSVFNKI